MKIVFKGKPANYKETAKLFRLSKRTVLKIENKYKKLFEAKK